MNIERLDELYCDGDPGEYYVDSEGEIIDFLNKNPTAPYLVQHIIQVCRTWNMCYKSYIFISYDKECDCIVMNGILRENIRKSEVVQQFQFRNLKDTQFDETNNHRFNYHMVYHKSKTDEKVMVRFNLWNRELYLFELMKNE